MGFYSILDPPENVQLMTNATASKACQNDVVSFMCSADAVPSAMSFQLFKDNVPMETSDSGMWTKPLSEGGLFAYKCVANNSIGSTSSASVSITVNGKWGSHILMFKHFSVSKMGKTNVQLALQHCCKSDVARLPPKFKPVTNWFVKRQVRCWSKCATSLLNSFCSNVARQVVCFFVGCFTVHLRMIWLILLTHSLNSMFTVMIVMTEKLYERKFLN